MDLSKIIIVRQKRKSMVMNVLSDGTIQVKAPSLMPKFIINDFIKKNEEWIDKRLNAMPKIKHGNNSYTDGDKFLFLGKEYAFKTGNYKSIQLHEDNLLFPVGLVFRAKKELENWYIKQAREFIKSQLVKYAKEMKTTYVTVSFSDTSSKWGSCTHDNRLQFNFRLIMAPILTVRYVVVHELAHTIEKNHSHKFWSIVRVFNPSYKEQIKWLNKNGDSLII